MIVKIMNKRLYKYISVVFLFVICISQGFGQQKLGQTGFQFLSVGMDARASAMAGAYNTVEGTPNTLFYNPAGLAGNTATAALFVNSFTWIADIKYSSLSLAFDPWDGNHGTFGFTVSMVDYGELQGSMVWPNERGYIRTEMFEPKAIAVGLGYATYLTNKFAVGGHVRYVSQTLGKSAVPGEETHKNVAGVLAVDMGTIYKTGFKTLVFGMSVRNFSKEIKFEEVSFELPLTFTLSTSIGLLDAAGMASENHKILMVLDAVHPESHPEYINWGLEYSWQDIFSVRGGLTSSQDEYDFSAGFGVHQFGFEIDYAYTPFGVFGNIHRFSIGVAY